MTIMPPAMPVVSMTTARMSVAWATVTVAMRRSAMGVAWPPAGSSNCQSSFPVCESKARMTLSIAALLKTSPPAVTIGPPRLMVPVCWPGAKEPRGTFQTIFQLTHVARPIVLQ